MSASALNGDCPCSSSANAASRIFSGTVHSATIFTLSPLHEVPRLGAGLPRARLCRLGRPPVKLFRAKTVSAQSAADGKLGTTAVAGTYNHFCSCLQL